MVNILQKHIRFSYNTAALGASKRGAFSGAQPCRTLASRIGNPHECLMSRPVPFLASIHLLLLRSPGKPSAFVVDTVPVTLSLTKGVVFTVIPCLVQGVLVRVNKQQPLPPNLLNLGLQMKMFKRLPNPLSVLQSTSSLASLDSWK